MLVVCQLLRLPIRCRAEQGATPAADALERMHTCQLRAATTSPKHHTKLTPAHPRESDRFGCVTTDPRRTFGAPYDGTIQANTGNEYATTIPVPGPLHTGLQRWGVQQCTCRRPLPEHTQHSSLADRIRAPELQCPNKPAPVLMLTDAALRLTVNGTA